MTLDNSAPSPNENQKLSDYGCAAHTQTQWWSFLYQSQTEQNVTFEKTEEKAVKLFVSCSVSILK